MIKIQLNLNALQASRVLEAREKQETLGRETERADRVYAYRLILASMDIWSVDKCCRPLARKNYAERDNS